MTNVVEIFKYDLTASRSQQFNEKLAKVIAQEQTSPDCDIRCESIPANVSA